MKTKEEKDKRTRNVIFPTKLSFEEMFPEDSDYETPNSVKFLRKFYFKEG